MKLLVQGDDFGFTKGVTYGIVDAIDNGILRNTGLFANMPDAALAVSFMKDRPQACFGIDYNIVSGPPCSDPADIPHLVDENGQFIRSGKRIRDERWQSEEGRAEMFPLEEVYREMRAQYSRFLELTGGKKPGYMHTHSLHPEPYMKALRQMAAEENIPFSHDIQKKYGFCSFLSFSRPSSASAKKQFDAAEQLNKNPLAVVKEHADELLAQEYVNIGGHPGFVDAKLLGLTTLSLERIRDHEMDTSEWIKNWIKENNIELVTYYDLV